MADRRQPAFVADPMPSEGSQSQRTNPIRETLKGVATRVDRLVAEVEKSRAVADVVVVFLHWGVELDTCPTVSQQTLANAMSPDGARSGVLEVVLTGRHIDDYRWRPARIGDGVPVPLQGEEAADEIAAWDRLRACTELAR